MNTDELIAALNEEIARLEEARRLLRGGNTLAPKPGHSNTEADGGSTAQEMGS
jgi:hypothetical protein